MQLFIGRSQIVISISIQSTVFQVHDDIKVSILGLLACDLRKQKRNFDGLRPSRLQDGQPQNCSQTAGLETWRLHDRNTYQDINKWANDRWVALWQFSFLNHTLSHLPQLLLCLEISIR